MKIYLLQKWFSVVSVCIILESFLTLLLSFLRINELPLRRKSMYRAPPVEEMKGWKKKTMTIWTEETKKWNHFAIRISPCPPQLGLSLSVSSLSCLGICQNVAFVSSSSLCPWECGRAAMAVELFHQPRQLHFWSPLSTSMGSWIWDCSIFHTYSFQLFLLQVNAHTHFGFFKNT